LGLLYVLLSLLGKPLPYQSLLALLVYFRSRRICSLWPVGLGPLFQFLVTHALVLQLRIALFKPLRLLHFFHIPSLDLRPLLVDIVKCGVYIF